MNSLMPAAMQTAPTAMPMAVTESRSRRKTISEKTTQSPPVTRKIHQRRAASGPRSEAFPLTPCLMALGGCHSLSFGRSGSSVAAPASSAQRCRHPLLRRIDTTRSPLVPRPPCARYRLVVPIRVVLADDSLIVREGIAQLLATAADIEIAASCSDLESLLEAVDRDRPDVVLTDIRMPPSGTDEGIQVAARLTRKPPGRSEWSSSASTRSRAMRSRCSKHGSDRRAYLLKERVHDRAQLLSTMQAVADGGIGDRPEDRGGARRGKGSRGLGRR